MEEVKEAARAILAYEDRDEGAWRGRTALEVVEEALPEDADPRGRAPRGAPGQPAETGGRHPQ